MLDVAEIEKRLRKTSKFSNRNQFDDNQVKLNWYFGKNTSCRRLQDKHEVHLKFSKCNFTTISNVSHKKYTRNAKIVVRKLVSGDSQQRKKESL